jgi:hypothetical protein
VDIHSAFEIPLNPLLRLKISIGGKLFLRNKKRHKGSEPGAQDDICSDVCLDPNNPALAMEDLDAFEKTIRYSIEPSVYSLI